ncbi:MAG: sugar transferase [Flavobacteriales bacterium]|nr:sugar transferase [Flavobacteriales bacterium]
MIKRLFDLVFSATALLLLLPLLLVLAAAVAMGSPGGALFRQERVGLNGRSFQLLKFRSMRPGSEAEGQITIGGNDPRITRVGRVLRKTKLDELPQLWNVLLGDMSLVGPRPEVPRYVALYSPEQRTVLSVRPGITGASSLAYFEESELLARSSDPHRTYVEKMMRDKLALEIEYVRTRSFGMDLAILWRTFVRLFSH